MAKMKKCPWCSKKFDKREIVCHVLDECGQKPELEEDAVEFDVSKHASSESGEFESGRSTKVSSFFALC
jgi:hypothetical protein